MKSAFASHMYNHYRPGRAAVMFQIPPHCDPYLFNPNFIILPIYMFRVGQVALNNRSTVASRVARRNMGWRAFPLTP
jgi:hypothetical protein